MPVQQHKIKSEYAKAFKTHRESAQVEYSENMKFRRARRHQEVTHQPWAWLDVGISDEESELETSLARESPRQHSDNTAADNQSVETNSDFDASGAVNLDGDRRADERLISKLKNRALERAAEMRAGESETQQNQSNSGLRRPHHPVKGNPRAALPTMPANKTDHDVASKPRNDLRSINRDKLFLAYGWGSASGEASRKKTFNIKSDIDVYPSATRAMRSRQNLLKQQQLQRDKVATAANGPDSGRRPRSGRQGAGGAHSARSGCGIELDNRVAMQWLSEYQLRFPNYDNEVYRRGLANLAPRGYSARLEGPRTCRI